MIPINSLHNPRLKAAIRLHDSRGRRQQNRILINGMKETEIALKSSHVFVEIFVCRSILTEGQLQWIRETAERRQIPVLDLPIELFRRLAYGERDEGVAGVAYRPETSLSQLMVQPDSVALVLEDIEKPGNLGAVARSADGAGIPLLISANPRTDFFHPNAIRSSLGTVFTLGVAEGSAVEVKAWLLEHGFAIFATIVESATLFWNESYTGKIAIVLGNESKGLSSEWRSSPVRAIRLPMQGAADSLNISVTAAVLAYEIARQRNLPYV